METVILISFTAPYFQEDIALPIIINTTGRLITCGHDKINFVYLSKVAIQS